MKIRSAFLVVIMVLAPAPSALSAETSDLEITVATTEAQACTASAAGLTFQEPHLNRMFPELWMFGRQEPLAASASITLHAAPDVPWRCVGGMIFVLQREGYTNLRFGVELEDQGQ